jgi:hypothetical protein
LLLRRGGRLLPPTQNAAGRPSRAQMWACAIGWPARNARARQCFRATPATTAHTHARRATAAKLAVSGQPARAWPGSPAGYQRLGANHERVGASPRPLLSNICSRTPWRAERPHCQTPTTAGCLGQLLTQGFCRSGDRAAHQPGDGFTQSKCTHDNAAEQPGQSHELISVCCMQRNKRDVVSRERGKRMTSSFISVCADGARPGGTAPLCVYVTTP